MSSTVDWSEKQINRARCLKKLSLITMLNSISVSLMNVNQYIYPNSVFWAVDQQHMEPEISRSIRLRQKIKINWAYLIRENKTKKWWKNQLMENCQKSSLLFRPWRSKEMRLQTIQRRSWQIRLQLQRKLNESSFR